MLLWLEATGFPKAPGRIRVVLSCAWDDIQGILRSLGGRGLRYNPESFQHSQPYEFNLTIHQICMYLLMQGRTTIAQYTLAIAPRALSCRLDFSGVYRNMSLQAICQLHHALRPQIAQILATVLPRH